MKVTPPDGSPIDIGTIEASPTIGIEDYSRRETDAFGVTTVVRRSFSRHMSVRLGVPTLRIDETARLLTTLRAKAALWVADERLAWLSVTGYFDDLSIDLPSGDLSFCTLKVAGLAETETVADPGGEPTVHGRPSTLRFVDPAALTDAVLSSSSVAENDAPAWSAGTTYPAKATVVRNHRIYESLVASNVGADPATSAAKWLDTGPTNRWAMFDQALGTSTIASSVVEAVLKPATPVTALALLDTNAATVRVQAPGYDRTAVPDTAGKALFLDLAVQAGATITVTVTPATANPGPQRWDDGAQWMDAGVWRDSLEAGDGTVTIGTFLLGEMKGLGTTEASPTAGITDYSLKETDEFGEVTVVERAWAKNMAVRSLIRTDAVDVVANRIAAVRAQPALWIGDTARDSLVVYGFFRDFSIEVTENVSKLSLSIEGLSKAAPVVPASGGSVAWPDITDPDGTKPTDNADKTSENTSKDTNAVGGVPAEAITGRLGTLETVTIPAIEAAGAAAGQRITETRAAADLALSTIESEVERVDQRIDNLSASGGYDDTAIKAQITDERELSLGRDAALGTRIDTVSASIQTTDTNLRALVQTKEQAAVSREEAIAKRIDDLIAEGGGGSDGVDTVARAEIQRVEQAAVLRDTALASRTSLMEATASTTAGGISSNSSFAIWPDGQELPNGWNWWANFLTIERRPRTDGGGGYAARLSSGAGVQGGLVQAPVSAFPGWYVLDADVELIEGSYVGAGVTIQDVVGINFATHPDMNGDISATRTGRRRFTLLIHLPSTLTNWHAMNGWAGWGGIAAKTVDWYRCSMRLASDAEIKAGKADAALPGITARIKSTEDTLIDLPNRYATAQRATNIEASVGAAAGRIGTLERVTSDGTLVTSQRADNIEASLNDSRATVSQQAGVIVGLGQKTAAYVRIIADAGNGRASLSLWSDQYGGAWQLAGNGQIDGNLTVNGTIKAEAFDGASMAREVSSSWNGPALTPAPGEVFTNFWTLGLPTIPPTGRFIYEYTFYLDTNAGTGFSSTVNGRPAYTQYVEDGGGLTLFATDAQGNAYHARANGSDKVYAVTSFAPIFGASIRRGSRDTGFISDGDNYSRQVAATFTIHWIRLKVTWVAI